MRRALWPICAAMFAGEAVGIACSDFAGDTPSAATTDAGDAASPSTEEPDAGIVIPVEALDSGAGSADATAEKSSYGSAVLADEPIAYWRMNLSGGVVPNVIAQQPALVVVDGSKATSIDGALVAEPDNGAIALTGTLLSAALPSSYDFTDQPFTLECWAKSGKEGAVMPILAKAKVSQFLFATSFDGYSLALDDKNAPSAIYGSSSLIGSAQIFGNTATPNDWHHYVVTAGEKLALYIDGVLAKEIGRKGRPASKSSAPFSVGGVSGSSIAGTFTGSIDEVAIYNGNLDVTRIQAHFNAATPNAK